MKRKSSKTSANAPQAAPVAKVPRPFWKQPLNADFKTFFKALGKGVAHFAAGKSEDLIADTAKMATAIGIKMPPEELAWRLVERSLQSAVESLVEEAKDVFLQFELTEATTEKIAERIDTGMKNIEIPIARDFFERPGDSPIAVWMQKTLTLWLQGIGLKPSKAEGLSSRLPSYFTFALKEEWQKKKSIYQPLRDLVDSPFAKAGDRAEQWNLYAAWLTRQADQRMFDETFSLKQLYVRPRAAFEIKKTKDRIGTQETHAEKTPQQQAVWLDQCLSAWLEQWSGNDAIRVLSGGPGSGKSAFSRLFAAEVARRGKCRVIYVPLHLFELKADLVAAVHSFCETHPYLPKNVLDAKEGERKLLLIFDGLDELEKQGRMAAQVASEFVAEVSRVTDRVNQAEPHVMVMLCGRPVAVQASENVLRREEQVLHLLPYFVRDAEAKDYADPLKILPTDQRDEWWAKYGGCVGKAYSALPNELKRDDFTEVTSQPLLNYLVALSFDRGKLDFESNVNLNVVYHDLLDAVYERGYEKRPTRSVQGLSQGKFIRILEEIGLAAWHGDGRTTTVKKIELRCAKSPAVKQTLAQFAGDAEAGVTRLLTAFYFRQHGDVDCEKTFEFTHKSFGEYLTACRIVREIKLIHDQLVRCDSGDEGGFDEAQALERWLDICGPSEITNDLNRFLQREIATMSAAMVQEWQSTFVRLINHFLRYGMPMERLSPLPTFKEVDRQARNATECLLATLHSCAIRSRVVSKINFPEPTSLGTWLSNLAPQRSGPGNRVSLESLQLMQIARQDLYCHDLYAANLNHAEMTNCGLMYATLSSATLVDAILVFADLTETNLSDANLTGANLSQAGLKDANLKRAILTKATLARANLTRANLTGADLTGADLTRADLTGADLTGANLTRADLRGADLTRANLTETNLTETNLTETKLTETKLTETKLTETKLSGAKRSRANLPKVELTEADPTQTAPPLQ